MSKEKNMKFCRDCNNGLVIEEFGNNKNYDDGNIIQRGTLTMPFSIDGRFVSAKVSKSPIKQRRS